MLEEKKKQALAELEKAKEAKNKQVAKKKKVIDNEWSKFCMTLRMDHWVKAQKLWAKLDKSGSPQPILKANTKELYEKGFKFDSIANNQDTQAILQDLDIAQINLNQNPNNEILLKKFIATAQEASKELRSKYKDFWRDPGEALIKEEQEDHE